MRRLVADVASGRFAAGDWLPKEVDLADRFSVSRGVVRETVQALKERHVVEVRHGRGARVSEDAAWDLLDEELLAMLVVRRDQQRLRDELLECRRLLEPAAARLAAQRATREDLDELTDAHARMAEARHAAPIDAEPADDFFFLAETAFCDALASAAQNRPLRRMLRPTYVGLALARDALSPKQRPLALAAYRRTLDALAAADPEAAERTTLDHLEELSAMVTRARRGKPARA